MRRMVAALVLAVTLATMAQPAHAYRFCLRAFLGINGCEPDPPARATRWWNAPNADPDSMAISKAPDTTKNATLRAGERNDRAVQMMRLMLGPKVKR